jgi:hypothetical protein
MRSEAVTQGRRYESSRLIELFLDSRPSRQLGSPAELAAIVSMSRAVETTASRSARTENRALTIAGRLMAAGVYPEAGPEGKRMIRRY